MGRSRDCLCGALLLVSIAVLADEPASTTRGLRYQGTASVVAVFPSIPASPSQFDEAKPPSGSDAVRRGFWYEQNRLARQLGDPEIWRRLIERASLDLQGDREATAFFKTQYWQYIRSNGTPNEILAAAEDLLLRYPEDFSRYFEAAIEYARLQNFVRAQALITQGQAVAARKRLDAFGQRTVEYALWSAQRDLAEARGQFEEAMKYAVKLIAVADYRATEANVPANSKRWSASYQLGAVGVRRNYVSLLIRMGELEKAREQLREVERLLEKFHIEGSEHVLMLGARAQIEMAAGNFKLALDLLRRAEQQFLQLGVKDTGSWLLNNRAKQMTVLLALGRFAESAEMARRLDSLVGNDELLKKRVGPGIDRAISWSRIGLQVAAQDKAKGLSKGNHAKYAPDHYYVLRDDALVLALTQLHSPSPAGLAQLGELCERLLASHSALATNAVEKIYRNFILQAYLQGLAASGSHDPAAIDAGFHIADALRESTVGDVVINAAMRSASRQPGLAELVARQRSLKLALDASFDNLAAAQGRDERDGQVVANLRQTLRAQQDEQLQLEKDIARRFPEYNQLTAAEPVRLKDVARLLNRNEVLVSILPSETATFVWVLTRDSQPMFFSSRLSQERVRELVAKLRKTLDVGGQTLGTMPVFDQAAARLLYDELLAPARKTLAGRTHLIINAAGPLGQLPFGVLQTGPVTTQGPAWLVREQAVTHIASVGAFASLRQTGHRAVASKPFIGFGDPAFSLVASTQPAGVTRNLGLQRTEQNEDLLGALKNYGLIPPLPETREELLAIANALGANPQQDVFLGKAATREAVLNAALADYQVISFSTHGLMAGDLPGLTQPALALAVTDQAGVSPLLTLEDVLGLKLNADWVVLSACNTAAADGEASEALSGLGRGFFYAGARALLVTHWAVESESARQLVTATFKAYGEDKSMSRADALRRAQLKLIESKRYAHPFYWAPYALVGDGG